VVLKTNLKLWVSPQTLRVLKTASKLKVSAHMHSSSPSALWTYSDGQHTSILQQSAPLAVWTHLNARGWHASLLDNAVKLLQGPSPLKPSLLRLSPLTPSKMSRPRSKTRMGKHLPPAKMVMTYIFTNSPLCIILQLTLNLLSQPHSPSLQRYTDLCQDQIQSHSRTSPPIWLMTSKQRFRTQIISLRHSSLAVR